MDEEEYINEREARSRRENLFAFDKKIKELVQKL